MGKQKNTIAVHIRPATRDRYYQWAKAQSRKSLIVEDITEAVEEWLDRKGAKA